MLPRTLPAKPDWAVPVGVARPPARTDLELIAKIEQNARKTNARRLVCFGRWYDQQRAAIAAGKAPQPVEGCPK